MEKSASCRSTCHADKGVRQETRCRGMKLMFIAAQLDKRLDGPPR